MSGPVLTPAGGISPRVALATSLQAAPGVYAVLLGSGISSATGIPTGHQIVEDLIGRVARAQAVDIAATGLTPEDWWVRETHGPPSYSSLLEGLSPTQASRQAVLRSYFEPSPDMPNRRIPTPAHRALAELCSQGYVRVILTTNFDRLMEQALSELGVAPQVIDRPSAASAMTPLCHSPVTIVKLHGDYLSTELRNTAEELTSYPPEWLRLLHQIFDEYGLVVVGWSGDYDVALADCVSDVVNRRYPMYWGARNGHISEAAQRIIQRRSAYKIPLASADEFLCDLRDQVVRLNVLAKRRPRFAIHRHPIAGGQPQDHPQLDFSERQGLFAMVGDDARGR